MADLGAIHIAVYRLSGLIAGHLKLRGLQRGDPYVLKETEAVANDLLKWVEWQRNPKMQTDSPLTLAGLMELEANIPKTDGEVRVTLIRRGKALREALESFGMDLPPRPAFYTEPRRTRK